MHYKDLLVQERLNSKLRKLHTVDSYTLHQLNHQVGLHVPYNYKSSVMEALNSLV